MGLINEHEPGRPGVLEALASSAGTDRRTFLKRTGAAAAILGAAACVDGDPLSPALQAGGASPAVIPLGSGDTAVLNYALALEMLEAGFYERVIASPYAGISGAEFRTLHDIRDHEFSHRDFLRAALGSAAIPSLSLNFSAVNFADRGSVLTTAQTFEDLGVAAYNGAGELLSSADYLLAAGKIVSVEARHASIIRLFRSSLVLGSGEYSRFAGGAGVVDGNGLDQALTPAQVLAAAAPFFNDTFVTTGLPTS